MNDRAYQVIAFQLFVFFFRFMQMYAIAFPDKVIEQYGCFFSSVKPAVKLHLTLPSVIEW